MRRVMSEYAMCVGDSLIVNCTLEGSILPLGEGAWKGLVSILGGWLKNNKIINIKFGPTINSSSKELQLKELGCVPYVFGRLQ